MVFAVGPRGASRLSSERFLRTLLTGARSLVRLGEQTHTEFLQEAAAGRVQARVPATERQKGEREVSVR